MAEEDMKQYRRKSHVYDGMVRSPNRAMMRETGMKDEDFDRPIVGVVTTWAENTPCNIHLHDFGNLLEDSRGGWRKRLSPVRSETGDLQTFLIRPDQRGDRAVGPST